MANSVYDDKVPGEHELADNQNVPLGDPSDPRGDYNPRDNKTGDDSDLLGDLKKGEEAGDQTSGGNIGNSAEPAGGLASREFGLGAGVGGARVLPKGASPALDRMEKLSGFLGRNKKKGLFGGGAVGVIAALTLLAFFVMIPLKIENMVKGMQKHFMAASEQAIGTETQNMLERYMVAHVLPSYKRCGTTLSKDCSVSIATSSNPVTAMYKAWAQNKLETTLATDYGIEFKFDKAGNTWYLKAPGTTGQGDNIGVDGSKLDGDFQRADRATMRAAFSDALDGSTNWKKMHMRFQVGRLLEEKYGVRRCNLNCEGTATKKADQLADYKDQKAKAAQLLIAQRVIQPRNAALGVVIECLINSCAAEDTQTTTPQEGTTGELEGAPENPDTDGKIRDALTQLAGTYGISSKDSIDQMVEDYKNISENGYQKYALDKVLEKLGLSAFSEQATDAVPIINLINVGAGLVTGAHNLGPTIRKGTYVVGATGAVSMATMYLSYADEIHTGNVDATEVGSLVDSLGPGEKIGNNDPVGGAASAEQSPLYQAVLDPSSASATTTASLLDNLLPGKASAATTNADSSYKCSNGNPVPSGKLVCSESALGHGVGAADNVSSFLDTPGINVITSAAGAIKGFTGAIAGIFGSIISSIPGATSLSALVSGPLQKVLTAGVNTLVPNPFGNGNTSGARNAEIAGTGFEVIGNDACAQIGCQDTDSTTAMNVINQQTAEEKQNFVHESYFARMFDTSSSYSLVSRLAMATPFNIQASAQSGMASLMSNPFGSLLKGFGSLSPFGHASAATAANSADPAHIGNKVYPTGTIPKNGEQYWDDNNCGDTSDDGPIAKWQKAASDAPKNPNTGAPVYSTTEPCLLIKGTVSDAGGKFETTLLSADEQQVLTSSSSSGSGGSGVSGALPSGSAKELATQLKSYVDSGKLKCLATGCPDIIHTADGTSIKGGEGCSVDTLNPQLVGMLLKLMQAGHTFILSALCSDHGSDGNGGHSGGKAADFNTIDGVFMGPSATAQWDSTKLAAGKKLDQDIASFMPKDTGFGQIQCHPTFDFLSKFKTFDDTCHHQHIQVPGS